jgi:hypothetical protein
MSALKNSVTTPIQQSITALSWKVDALNDKLAEVQKKVDNAQTRKPK